MAEENNGVTQVEIIDDKDWFLQDLVKIVNSGGFSFGITLNVGGLLVSGQLVGGKEYFEGFGSDFAGVFSDSETAKVVQESFAKRGEIYSSDKETLFPLTYIHVKEARFFNNSGKPIPGNRGVWWRGKLSQVNGFSLGSLSAENF